MFSFLTATEHRGAASSAFTLSEAATRGILCKKVFLKILQNIKKHLFYRASPNNCFFLLLSSDNLLTGQQKIDLCYIKSSFQIYQLSFLNKKLTEVFVYILN